MLSSLKACALALTGSGEIIIETSCSEMIRPLPSDVNEQIFHIGKDAIANAVRHASPTRVTIDLDYRPDCVQLKISDNGRGFMLSGDLLGFGLRSMRKRASEISGVLEISSTPGAGTCVSARVPLIKVSRVMSYILAGVHFMGKAFEYKLYAKAQSRPRTVF